MAYAQKNYLQVQGIAGKYRIDQIGCFLTAFCNLMGDFGRDISPLDLNNHFVRVGAWIDVDDGIRDDLGWGSISALDGDIVTVRSADHGRERTAGWPGSNQSIVRFYYQSVTQPLINGRPNMIYHFCKVVDAANHVIVDSWDGVVKKSPYGEPTGWAEYRKNQPVPVAPAPVPTPPKVVKPYTVEPIATKKVQLLKDVNIWGMNYDNWVAINKNPIAPVKAGDVIEVNQIIRHNLSGVYYSPVNMPECGINIVDVKDYVEAQPEPPAPPQPPAEPVTPARPETPAQPEAPVSSPAPTENDTTEDWEASFSRDGAGEYDSEVAYEVFDLKDPTKPTLNLPAGQVVQIVGRWIKDGKTYYKPRTKTNGVDHHYGIPAEVLGAEEAEEDDDELFEELRKKHDATQQTFRELIVSLGGILWDIIAKVLHIKTKKRS